MTMKSFLKKIIAATLLLSVFASCADEFTSPDLASGSSITDLVVGSEDFDLLEAALVKTGLASAYATNVSGTFTVFAPNDAGFLTYLQGVYSAATPPTNEAEALAKIESLTNISTPLNLGTLVARLNYHIVSSEVKAAQITGAQTLSTLNGARLSLSVVNSEVLLNGNLSGGAKVVSADVDASNGVVHVIDKVMPVPSTTSTVLTPFALTINYGTAPATIGGGSETAGDANGADFDILAYAIRRANLVSALIPNKTPIPDFTIFAPTDNAMRAYLGDTAPATATLENAAIQSLKALDPSALADILKYHVVSGRYLSTDLSNGQSVTTLFDQNFTVQISSDAVPVLSLDDKNSGTNPVITATNNINNNGVVHTINAVLRSN